MSQTALTVSGRTMPDGPLTPSQKAAIVLAALGPDRAAPLMRDMNESQLRHFAVAISGLRRVPQATIVQIMSEFEEALGEGIGIAGGSEAARRMLDEVLDGQQVARIMSDVDNTMNRSFWNRLGQAPSASVALFLQNEHPQTAAVVLSELRADRAAGVLECLDEAFAQDVVLRLSRVPRLDRHVLALVERIIVETFLSAAVEGGDVRSPADLIAGMMNNLSATTRHDLLGHLDRRDPDLSDQVQKVMFTFGDLPRRVEPRDVATVVRNIEETTLLTALASAQATYPDSVSFVLENISRRLSERFAEELRQFEDVKLKVGEKAQSEMITEIQRLADTKEITLIQPDA
ncbi:flagellar motor switch protein FliG [Roseobacter sp. HKCCA0434]|uniref:flagellar motor switch protein FliG n=1 Tax=Roseobacter sp. HKCCA0434 TaxID=3079297 RepID=UPI002905A51A|nr:FliG C-terminal domain-containing protein [Roseobacter sp. HKCCA0434]